MIVALGAAGLFLAAFAVHWTVWRIRIPRRQTATLLFIFFAVLGGGLAATCVLPSLNPYGAGGYWPLLHIAIFHVAGTFAYVVAYSALEERSPSMRVLTHVGDSGPRGCDVNEIMQLLNETITVESRIAAMRRDRMLTQSDGIYRLTSKGRAWGRVFLHWKRLLRLPAGG